MLNLVAKKRQTLPLKSFFFFCFLICIKYSEVARTRLREEGDRYKKFFQTIILVYREEGIRKGIYRGLATQLLRN